MVKIKRKVELEPKAFLFGPEVTANGYVSYNKNKNTYTVEFEEEITEETIIPKLAHYYVHSGMSLIATRSEKSISEVLNVYTKGEGIMNLAFYMLNDDMTMTLIWKDGGMVE